MRDHRKLKAFDMADDLALHIYRITSGFPKEEMYGLTSQMRKAAISVPSNIVEGCARETHREYFRFLVIAFGSLRELHYQISLADRLGYIQKLDLPTLNAKVEETEKVMNGLIRSLRKS